MKKYLFGIGALLIAITMVAFTPGKTERGRFTDVYFSFDRANNLPTQANMENPAKWILSASQDATGCPGSAQRGCKIKVDATDVQGSQLKSGTVIPTQFFATDVYKVVAGSDVLSAYNTTN